MITAAKMTNRAATGRCSELLAEAREHTKVENDNLTLVALFEPTQRVFALSLRMSFWADYVIAALQESRLVLCIELQLLPG